MISLRALWVAVCAAFVAVISAQELPAPHERRPTEEFSLSHSPEQPRSGEAVTVTAKVPGEKAVLQVQVVEPGAYVRRTDAGFENSWREFPMERHGPAFIARVPGELQKHRRLVRYRVKGAGEKFFPAKTNAVPNGAWFSYDGLPEWKGASRPGREPIWTFTPEFLGTLPTYHLIANGNDVKESQWDQQAYRKPFLGTLVYDGKVYDHIQFNNRGQASSYVAGKNKWGVKFNAGEAFEARNNRGEAYRFKWTGFNMNPCASAWAQVNRGMAGLDEAISYRVYQLAGVPSPDTFWIHFRVVDSAAESAANQFNSDLWGLYLIVQEKNGTWLKERGLPDGDIFSIDSGPKHLAGGKTQGARRSRMRGAASEEAWRANLDLTNYYSFHALNRYVANIDLRPDGNHYLYYRPDGRVTIVPHDLDMMLIPKHHQPGYVLQQDCLRVPALKLEYQARARELLDLLASDASTNGGQIGQLVAELASVLRPAGHERNWAELDEAMWNWHSRTQHKGQFNVTPYDDHRMGGGWTRTLATPDFAGFCKYILDFCTDSRPRKNFRPNDGNQMGYGYGYLSLEAKDDKIPERPMIRYVGGRGYPSAKLRFAASEYKSSAGTTGLKIQWRVAAISAPEVTGYKAGSTYKYELETLWTAENEIGKGIEIQVPANTCVPGNTYRVRARYCDQTGRWSHWSEAIQFVASGG
ncbi:MAG TPA: CotH kinase family protein [Verrucomicrobiae bacterium]